MLQTTWGWLIAIYLFLGGLGAGAFLCSALAYKGFLGKLDSKFYNFGFLLAPVAVIVGTALLLFDLAPSAAVNPFKILQLYTRPVSMMSIGTYLLTFFIIVSFVVLLQVRKEVKICDYMLIIGSILAIGVMGYTGLLLYVVKAVPLWASMWLPILFTVSAISTGFSANAISSMSGGGLLSHKSHKFHIILVAVEIFALLMLFANARHEAAGMMSITKMVSGSLAVVFWVGFVILGLALPLISGLKGLIVTPCVSANTQQTCVLDEAEAKGSTFSEFGVLIGGFCLRVIMVFSAIYIF